MGGAVTSSPVWSQRAAAAAGRVRRGVRERSGHPPSFICFIIWRIADCYASLTWVWLDPEEVATEAEADAPPKPSAAAAVTWFCRRLEER